jgi:hypothetical protein
MSLAVTMIGFGQNFMLGFCVEIENQIIFSLFLPSTAATKR